MKRVLSLIAFILTVWNVIAQAPGETCGTAVEFVLPTTVGASTTTGAQDLSGYANDYPAGTYCSELTFGGGNDGIYSITVPDGGAKYTFEFPNSGMDYKILSIHSACPIQNTNCVGGMNTTWSPDEEMTITLEGGTYYLAIDNEPTSSDGGMGGVFTLNATLDLEIDSSLCGKSTGFCSDVVYDFENVVDQDAPDGVDYACLGSFGAKNPVWYYMEIEKDGAMEIEIKQTSGRNGTGDEIDTDFVLWGPFDQKDEACFEILSGNAAPIQSGYSASGIETIGIGVEGGSYLGTNTSCTGVTTPAAADSGKVYVVMITNYENDPGFITFSQTSGAGGADCSTITPCDISAVSATPGSCHAGGFPVTGTITFTDATKDTLIVQSSLGGTIDTIINPVSPQAYSLDSLIGNGGTGNVTAYFLSDTFCKATSADFAAPASLSPSVLIATTDLDSTTCNGGNIVFNATPTNGGTTPSYQWKIDGANVGTDSDSYTGSNMSTGEVVTVELTSNAACLTSSIATSNSITVTNEVFTPTLSNDQNDTICSGTDITYTVLNGGTTYRFYVNGVLTQNTASNSFTHTNGIHQDIITCFTSSDACSDSLIADTLIVNNSPNANLSVNDPDRTICFGESPIFTATPSGMSTYNFFINTSTVTGYALSATYTNNALSDQDSVMVIVTDTNNCVDTSAYILMTVNPLPTIGLSNTSTNDSICDEESVVFTASGAATYDFQVNNLSQQNSAIDTFDITSLSDNAIVFAIGTDANGCSDSSHIDTFAVTTVNNVLLTNDATNNTICAGGTITFNASGASNYEFFLNDTSILNSTVDNFSADSLENDEYVYVVGSVNGCTDTSNVDTVIVSNDIIASLTNDGDANLVCQGATITFTASGGDNFVFKLNEDTIQDGTSNIYVTDSLVDGDDIEVIVTSGVGGVCIDSTINDMTVSPNPTASLTDNNLSNTICDRDTVIYTASGGTNYNFILNDTASLQNSASPTFNAVNLNSGDKIYVIVANASNCLDTSATDTVTVNELPSLVFGVDDSILCVDQEVTFTTSGGTNYHYFLNDSSVQNSATATYVPDSAIQNDSVFVVVSDANNCSDTSRIISLDVNANPEVDLISDLAGDSVCNGNTITLTDTFNQGTNYNFAIGALSQQDGPENAFSSDELSDGDQINVTVTNANNCSTEDSIIVTVITTTGTLVSSDGDNIICAGDTVIYTASGGSSYVFFSNSTVIDSTDSISIVPEDGDTISVIVTELGCPDTIALLPISANNTPTILFDVDDSTICPGTDINLTAGGGSNYEFVMNGVTLQDSSLTNLTIENAVQDDSIFVIVSTGNNCIDTSYILTIDTNAIPNVALFSNASGDSACVNESVTFYDSVNTAASFEFIIDGVSTTIKDSFYTATVEDGDLIQLIVTSSDGCTNEDSLQMTVNSVTAGLNLSDLDNSICIGDPVTYSASGGSSYVFYVNDTLVSTIDEITITPSNGDVISVSVSEFGCSDSTNLPAITVNNYDIADFSFDNSSYCASGSTLPLLDSLGTTGTWSANSSDLAIQVTTGELFLSSSLVGDYIVTFVSDGPCPDTHASAVSVQPALTEPITEDDFTICNDNSVTISGNEIVVGTLSWDVVSGNYSAIVNSDSSTATITGITPGETLTIYYEVSSPVCQDLRDTLIITHDSIPAIVFAGQDILCYSDTITLDASNPSVPRSGTWSSSDAENIFSDINGPNSYITNLSENGTTTLIWTVEDTFCSHFGTDTLLLTNQYSTATIVPEKDSAIILSPTTFALQETDLTSYEWFINGESMGSENPLTHSFVRPETHSIMITGMDNNGCPFTRTIPYDAFTVQDIFVGSFFTPNGDGKNDLIAPMGYLIDMESYQFNVYDRWGNLVFQSNSPHDYWDGTNQLKGGECPNDGYSWYLTIKKVNEEPVTLKGLIVLFR